MRLMKKIIQRIFEQWAAPCFKVRVWIIYKKKKISNTKKDEKYCWFHVSCNIIIFRKIKMIIKKTKKEEGWYKRAHCIGTLFLADPILTVTTSKNFNLPGYFVICSMKFFFFFHIKCFFIYLYYFFTFSSFIPFMAMKNIG